MARVRGVKLTRSNMAKVTFAVREAFAAELDDQADELLQLASDAAPQLTDALIESGDTDSDDTRNTLRRSVFFKVPYAPIQHEGIFNPGPKTAAKLGSQRGVARKFLQKPYEANRAEYIRRLAKAGNRALRLTLS